MQVFLNFFIVFLLFMWSSLLHFYHNTHGTCHALCPVPMINLVHFFYHASTVTVRYSARYMYSACIYGTSGTFLYHASTGTVQYMYHVYTSTSGTILYHVLVFVLCLYQRYTWYKSYYFGGLILVFDENWIPKINDK